MSAAPKNSSQREGAKGPAGTPSKLQAPWFIHVRVWIFMLTLSVSPFLYLLATQDRIEPNAGLEALVAVMLIQAALWMGQRRCASEDLSYWEGLLVVAAAMSTRIEVVSMVLSFGVLLVTVGASILFALVHDGNTARTHAPLCYGKLVVSIHKRRLY